MNCVLSHDADHNVRSDSESISLCVDTRHETNTNETQIIPPSRRILLGIHIGRPFNIIVSRHMVDLFDFVHKTSPTASIGRVSLH